MAEDFGFPYLWQVSSDWILRRCRYCDKDFPARPEEGMPLPDSCTPCINRVAKVEEERTKNKG